MVTADPDPLASAPLDALRVVLDANIFARRQWMVPTVEAAKAGHIVLLWSPAIIAEASRVLQWIRLSQRGRSLTESVKRETFDLARRWFDVMTAVFLVVEDRPPYDPLWSDALSDEHDRQIWTAAVRGHAHLVVTDNLRDGPPPDKNGLQIWEGMVFVHPDTFIRLIAWWPRADEGNLPVDEPARPTPDDTGGNRTGAQYARILEFLRTEGQTLPPESPTFGAEE